MPAVSWIKRAWPESRVSWLVNTEWTPLLEGNPDVDEIIPFPRRSFRGVAGSLRFVRWCRETIVGRRPDVAVDYQGLLRSALIGRASRARVLFGMADAREGARGLYDRVAPTPAGVPHAVDRYLKLTATLLQEAGMEPSINPRDEPRFPLPGGTPPGASPEGLERDFVLLHPFARGVGKSLTASQITAFCQRLAPRQVVLVGKRGENGCDVPGTVVNLLDQTSLSELIWIIRRATCVVSVDSGPSHLAAALGKPLVAIHTWSDPRRVGPYRPDARVWKNGRLSSMSEISKEEEAFFRQPPTTFSMADIDAICALVTSLSGSCA